VHLCAFLVKPRLSAIALRLVVCDPGSPLGNVRLPNSGLGLGAVRFGGLTAPLLELALTGAGAGALAAAYEDERERSQDHNRDDDDNDDNGA
jgi:hypothetical protein